MNGEASSMLSKVVSLHAESVLHMHVRRQVKAVIAQAYLAAKRETFIHCGVQRWQAVVPYVTWWRPLHDLETARSLVDASFPGFTPFQVRQRQLLVQLLCARIASAKVMLWAGRILRALP